MTDPLSQVIQQLKPRAVVSKGISAAGSWAVQYSSFGLPGFCAMTQGRCQLAVEGEPAIELVEDDFVLLPATPAFRMSGGGPAAAVRLDPTQKPPDDEVRYGRKGGPPEMRQIGGWFSFESADAALIVALLPRVIHVRGVPQLTQLVRLLGTEAAGDAPGRALILERLVEILLIAALRAAPTDTSRPGIMRGLADPRIAAALRHMHAEIAMPLTVDALSSVAGLSRSAFFERFARLVGVRPMEYLQTWRMSVARDLLRREDLSLDEVAERVGYGSASTFSTAFRRHVGTSPGRFARQMAGATAL
jgi:AraC-like DNA-binding protein